MSFLVVGLGNPGKPYVGTRHNVGFETLNRIADKLGLSFRKPLLAPYLLTRSSYAGTPLYCAKPLTYMNRSGDALPKLLKKTSAQTQEMIVVCDTLDLPVGKMRFKKRGSSAGHRGLKSIIETLHTEDFMRLYIGIGRPQSREEVVSYVLSRPAENEVPIYQKTFAEAAEKILNIAKEFHRDAREE